MRFVSVLCSIDNLALRQMWLVDNDLSYLTIHHTIQSALVNVGNNLEMCFHRCQIEMCINCCSMIYVCLTALQCCVTPCFVIQLIYEWYIGFNINEEQVSVPIVFHSTTFYYILLLALPSMSYFIYVEGMCIL